MQWKDGLNGTFDTHQVNGLNRMGHLIHIQWTDKMDVTFDLHPASECMKWMGHLIHIQWMNGLDGKNLDTHPANWNGLDGKFGYTSSELEWTGWDISHNIHSIQLNTSISSKEVGFRWDTSQIIDIIWFLETIFGTGISWEITDPQKYSQLRNYHL